MSKTTIIFSLILVTFLFLGCGKEPATETMSEEVCDNYDCLISAASQCQPISVIVSYSEKPTLILPFPDYSVSGQIKYEIKKSSGVNDCILTFSPVASTLSISEEGRKNLLAQGMTDDQIDASSQMMNENLELADEEQTTCQSDANIITAFLTDEKKLTTVTNLEEEMGSYNVKVQIEGSLLSASKSKTVTYTLSSGQELICTVTIPLQPANTAVTINEVAEMKGYLDVPKTTFSVGERLEEAWYVVEDPGPVAKGYWDSKCERIGHGNFGHGRFSGALVPNEKLGLAMCRRFEYPGEYILRVKIYDCADIEREFGECFIDIEEIEEKGIEPLINEDIAITVSE